VNATVKFYTGFVIALALIVGLSFAAGYRVGHAAHAAHAGRVAGTAP
jgi:hypothetical protein